VQLLHPQLNMSVADPSNPQLSGSGTITTQGNPRKTVSYTVHFSMNGQATLVELNPRPDAPDGERLHLTLADGRFLTCQVLDESPYCAVIGEGPLHERRRTPRE
jgi:hypothetical protein